MSDEIPRLSVVIPVYNEEDNLEPLVSELVPVLESLSWRYEVLIVAKTIGTPPSIHSFCPPA